MTHAVDRRPLAPARRVVTTVHRSGPAAAGATSNPHHFLPQIQALRAIAVLLVLVYHLVPSRLTGGFAGVDVFFVISGYLMTSFLVRRTGPAASIPHTLGDFYARRIRRILPASLTVLTVVAVLTLTTVSRVEWDRYFTELRAAALYWENWSLASSSTDYLAGSVTSPVQHFWSLSLEEQFYLGWPLLLLIAGALARRARVAQTTAIAIVLVSSLAFSVYETVQDAPVAYFDTFTRLWEFAVGGLLAVLGLVARCGRQVSAGLAWAGLAAIAATALLYDGQTVFPGYLAALPVLGAAAVIASGPASAVWGPHALLRRRSVQYLGDISYSIYLWHFPLIVFWAAYTDRPLSLVPEVGLLVASIALAAASKRLVEDPLRHPRERSRSGGRRRLGGPGRAVVLGVALMVPVVVIASVALHATSGPEARARTVYAQTTAHPPTCYGAEVANRVKAGCTPTTVSLHTVVPDPLISDAGYPAGCQQAATRSEIVRCSVGLTSPASRSAGSPTRVALIGDSHATQWFPALADLARRRNWQVTTYLKSGCAFSDADSIGSSCAAWNVAVRRELAVRKYAFVIVSARSAFGVEAVQADIGPRAAGMAAAWRAAQTVGSKVIAITDVPQPLNAAAGSIPSCVYGNAHPSSCAFDRAAATRFDLVPVAAKLDPSVPVVDLTDYLCNSTSCPAVIGSVLVYIDDSHITTTFARSLEIPLQAALQRAGLRAG